MIIAIVPQLVPVAKEVKEATKKTIAGKISGGTLPVSRFVVISIQNSHGSACKSATPRPI